MQLRGIRSVVGWMAALVVGCGGGTVRTAPATEGAQATTSGGRTVTAQPAQPGAAPSGGALTIGGQDANFGVYRMSMGFQPDPARMNVTSGGTVDVRQALGTQECPGWVTERPDVIVSFDRMQGFLRFAFEAARAGEDTTLVIHGPDGRWYCNDDTVGRNPVVDFGDASQGQYDVWVGSYQSGAYVEGQLLVTELRNVLPGGGGAAAAAPTTPSAPSGSSALSVGGDSANFGVYRMSMGFQPDPATVDVTSGGTIDAQGAVGAACRGWVTQQPDVIVQFEQMAGFLRFGFRADEVGEDATLVINGPDGRWYCNDDAVGRNPVVDFADAAPGQYDVWVGSYESGAYVEGDLFVTELRNVTP